MKELTTVELNNKLALSRFHKALVADSLSFKEIEAMCVTMYKMGVTPTKTLKAYIGKHEFSIAVVYVDGTRHPGVELPPKFNSEVPSLLVYLKESWGGTIGTVKVKYCPALKSVTMSKYPLIEFTEILLK